MPRSTQLRSVVIHENGTDTPAIGDVLLAIGADSIREAAQWGSAARAVAVLVHGGKKPLTFDSVAGVGAVLVIERNVSWSEVAAVVYGLVFEGRETESGRGPTDLFALADSLDEAIGGSVVIHDRLMRVLSYSKQQQSADPARAETILMRQMPERLCALLDRNGVFAHLAASDDPVFVPEDTEYGLSGRMVVAVRSGRELLGSVWVSCADPLTGAARDALTESAQTVALHLLRSQASADLERQVESDLVIQLLEGGTDVTTAIQRLGLPDTGLRVIALQAYLDADRSSALLLAFERATTGFGWSRPGRTALASDTVYTLLPSARVTTARRWLTGLRKALPDQVTVCAGISGRTAAADLPGARMEADECLALRKKSPSSPAPAYDESWDDILLERLRTVARSGRISAAGPVTELTRFDSDNGTHYVATLRAWLESQGDPVQAGKALGVHENTVRYRLRKMAEITNVPLHNARKRLAMMIALAATDPE